MGLALVVALIVLLGSWVLIIEFSAKEISVAINKSCDLKIAKFNSVFMRSSIAKNWEIYGLLAAQMPSHILIDTADFA